MKITTKDVQQVARLSRLSMDEQQLESYTTQLNSILEYADMLTQLDTGNIAPTAHVLPLHNVLRPDEIKPSLPRDKAMTNAPDPVDGFFKVPKIIEG